MSFRISRRTLLKSAVMGAVTAAGTREVHGRNVPETVALSPALEIRDYRLFPTPDVMRFIVDVHNPGDTVVDAPTVGVKIPELGSTDMYGVAAPSFPVVYPDSSVALFGVAPDGLIGDDHWGNPEWFLCDDVQRIRSVEAENIKVTVRYETETISDVNMAVNFRIENLEDQNSPPFNLGGTVFDESMGICGVLLPWYFRPLLPRQSFASRINVARGMGYGGTPFVLVDNVHGLSVEVNVFPPDGFRGYSCPPAMPWNR